MEPPSQVGRKPRLSGGPGRYLSGGPASTGGLGGERGPAPICPPPPEREPRET